MNPEALRKEAAAAEFLAKLVSYGKDKERLTTRAAELRAQAQALEGEPIGNSVEARHGRHGAI